MERGAGGATGDGGAVSCGLPGDIGDDGQDVPGIGTTGAGDKTGD